MGAGRDVGYVSNQLMEVDARAQKQLDAVKDGLHGKIEDHLDSMIRTFAELEKTVIGAIGISQQERRQALQNVSAQIATLKTQQSDDTTSVLLFVQALERQMTNEIIDARALMQKIDADLRQDFWKLFFSSLWASIRGLFR
jgi:hypothetical protein